MKTQNYNCQKTNCCLSILMLNLLPSPGTKYRSVFSSFNCISVIPRLFLKSCTQGDASSLYQPHTVSVCCYSMSRLYLYNSPASPTCENLAPSILFCSGSSE